MLARRCIHCAIQPLRNETVLTHASHLEAGHRQGYTLIRFPESQQRLTSSQKHAASAFFAKPARFLISTTHPNQIPNMTNPEIAFVGRSNVGKSSLINRLVNNNKLVRTSSKPGHTRALNFFDIGGKMTLVDMPGYGFRSRDEWGDLILHYLRTRGNLKRLFIVVDPTAGIKESDKQIMQLLDQQPLSYQVILTKRDRLSGQAFDQSRAEIESYLARHAICCYPEMLATGKRRRSKKNEDQVAEDLAHVRWSVMKAAGIV
ncbi:P-loop containing nucleoside triphosphate hydrolase protein [Dichotomocladium elegans]|nr:P-loop containing nucleoside triphosphate hydrolase protein [Dichotomocladium elegans]